MKLLIYARVSTDKQELDQQIQACQRFCEYRKFEVAEVITDIMSGANDDRPGYLNLISKLRSLQYDGVVVFRLDRLGRNARELSLVLEELHNKGITVYSINENFDQSNPYGKAMLQMALIFAELEREQIADATKQRLQALKAAGRQLGRKRQNHDVKKLINAFLSTVDSEHPRGQIRLTSRLYQEKTGKKINPGLVILRLREEGVIKKDG